MPSYPLSGSNSFTREQKLQLLFFHLAKTKATSLIAYCIQYGLDRNDHDGVLWMLKSLEKDDESIITFIYGEIVLQLVRSIWKSVNPAQMNLFMQAGQTTFKFCDCVRVNWVK